MPYSCVCLFFPNSIHVSTPTFHLNISSTMFQWVDVMFRVMCTNHSIIHLSHKRVIFWFNLKIIPSPTFVVVTLLLSNWKWELLWPLSTVALFLPFFNDTYFMQKMLSISAAASETTCLLAFCTNYAFIAFPVSLCEYCLVSGNSLSITP